MPSWRRRLEAYWQCFSFSRWHGFEAQQMIISHSHTLLNQFKGCLGGGAAVGTPAGSERRVYSATATVAIGTSMRITVSASDRPGSKGEAQE